MAAVLPVAPPGGGGGGGAYSDAAAQAILARELQGEDVAKMSQIHTSTKNLMALMNSAKLQTLAKGILQISRFAFPDGYLATGYETLLKQHTINLIHNAMPPDLRFDFDYETAFDWDKFKGHTTHIIYVRNCKHVRYGPRHSLWANLSKV